MARRQGIGLLRNGEVRQATALWTAFHGQRANVWQNGAAGGMTCLRQKSGKSPLTKGEFALQDAARESAARLKLVPWDWFGALNPNAEIETTDDTDGHGWKRQGRGCSSGNFCPAHP